MYMKIAYISDRAQINLHDQIIVLLAVSRRYIALIQMSQFLTVLWAMSTRWRFARALPWRQNNRSLPIRNRYRLWFYLRHCRNHACLEWSLAKTLSPPSTKSPSELQIGEAPSSEGSPCSKEQSLTDMGIYLVMRFYKLWWPCRWFRFVPEKQVRVVMITEGGQGEPVLHSSVPGKTVEGLQTLCISWWEQGHDSKVALDEISGESGSKKEQWPPLWLISMPEGRDEESSRRICTEEI